MMFAISSSTGPPHRIILCWKSWLTTLWNRSITIGDGPRSCPAAYSTGK
uniref:CLPP5 n=1 Tax=Arundo donax TaxID=35708 RepID=A0A0A9EZC2_ARUDO